MTIHTLLAAIQNYTDALENVGQFLINLNTQLPYDSAIATLEFYSKRNENLYYTKTYT